jgi:hypothetical protein
LRLFVALRNGLKAIESEIRGHMSSPTPTALPVQRPEFPVFQTFKNNQGDKVNFTYEAHVQRLVFKARMRKADGTTQAVAVKLTQKYCGKAHQLLAEQNFAPTLYHCAPIPVRGA